MAVFRNNAVEILANEQGNRTLPSYVAFTDTERLVGEAAKNQAAMNPANTIFDAKRLIGRQYGDKTVRDDCKLWPFKISEGEKGKPMIQVQYLKQQQSFAPEQISSMVLEYVASISSYSDATHLVREIENSNILPKRIWVKLWRMQSSPFLLISTMPNARPRKP